ncbi:GntR family transcriptional regulator [Halanaerobium saccharolyticum]|uniref:GntR family transcriptional regulator n=1 Tax=Halanaerobium saccharolyticum TaxID=43595 RepID=A0A4R7Z6H2_9FIRM|nr:GntR family transcriptional regulator [Halanaerobium saccharolyticum]RAK11166.1 GntR family transcriptional regulator [Halanaerobium saccharolyticum]TDW07017.1 GntR family transcriptional regulator [Halanaerobium saccharolyticum]TDX63782.1 GntR family transcriptional regulator [Halanaerobium saccharolyticum]
MDILKHDKRPLYLKIKEHIENLIDQEIYEAGDKLPSETAFAKELDVSRASLREALRVLEKEGKIIKSQGVGTFVSKPIPRFKRGIEELFSVTDTIKKEGFTPGTIGLEVEKEKIDKHLALKMNIKEDEKILKIQRIRTADDKAVVFCIDYLNINIFPIDINDDFSHSLFDLLENKYDLKIKYAVTKIIPVTARERLMEKLNVKKYSPILLLEQMHYDDQERLFLYSKNYFRSDQFQFKVLRSR